MDEDRCEIIMLFEVNYIVLSVYFLLDKLHQFVLFHLEV